MLQSIGVIIAAAAIKVWGEKVQIVDPICTYIFSVLVIFTTVPVFKDCMKVLMESQPNGVDGTAIKAQIVELKDVYAVDDFHTWALAGNKNMCIVHVRLVQEDEEVHSQKHSKVYH